MRFEELNLSAPLLEAIAQLDFTEMTEIQEKAIPLLLEGKDVIGKSNTGTGKTAAFSIPDPGTDGTDAPGGAPQCVRSDPLPHTGTGDAGL